MPNGSRIERAARLAIDYAVSIEQPAELVTGRYRARCKSGYIMDSTGRACGRMASRGMLLCNDCLNAVAVSVVGTQGAGNGPRPMLWGLVAVALGMAAVGLAMISAGVLG